MALRPLTRDEVMTSREVAELLRVARTTIEYWARTGSLPAHKIGRRRFFLRDEVEQALRGELDVTQ